MLPGSSGGGAAPLGDRGGVGRPRRRRGAAAPLGDGGGCDEADGAPSGDVDVWTIQASGCVEGGVSAPPLTDGGDWEEVALGVHGR